MMNKLGINIIPNVNDNNLQSAIKDMIISLSQNNNVNALNEILLLNEVNIFDAAKGKVSRLICKVKTKAKQAQNKLVKALSNFKGNSKLLRIIPILIISAIIICGSSNSAEAASAEIQIPNTQIVLHCSNPDKYASDSLVLSQALRQHPSLRFYLNIMRVRKEAPIPADLGQADSNGVVHLNVN